MYNSYPHFMYPTRCRIFKLEERIFIYIYCSAKYPLQPYCSAKYPLQPYTIQKINNFVNQIPTAAGTQLLLTQLFPPLSFEHPGHDIMLPYVLSGCDIIYMSCQDMTSSCYMYHKVDLTCLPTTKWNIWYEGAELYFKVIVQ